MVKLRCLASQERAGSQQQRRQVGARALDRDLHARGLGAIKSIAGMFYTSKVAHISVESTSLHFQKVTCARRCHLRTCAGFDFYVRRR
jgi:hypothetical protein